MARKVKNNLFGRAALASTKAHRAASRLAALRARVMLVTDADAQWEAIGAVLAGIVGLLFDELEKLDCTDAALVETQVQSIVHETLHAIATAEAHSLTPPPAAEAEAPMTEGEAEAARWELASGWARQMQLAGQADSPEVASLRRRLGEYNSAHDITDPITEPNLGRRAKR